MLTLDDDEAELALLGLCHLRYDATNREVYGAAWRCCKHVAFKCDKLIKRIEQWQQDQKEEADDATTS